MNCPDAVETVFARIEEIAANLLVQEDVASFRDTWVSSLRNLTEFARGAGQTDVASAAQSAADAIADSAGVPDDDLLVCLERSVSRLRDAAARADAPFAAQGNVSAAGAPVSIADDPELIADFVVECREHLETIEARLLSLEQEAHNAEALHAVFRSFHTIKGLAGFLELPRIQEVAHEVETVLDLARQGRFPITARCIDVILESKDYLARWLRYLDHGRSNECPADLSDNERLLRRISELLRSESAPAADGDTPDQDAVPDGAGAGARPSDRGENTNRSIKVSTTKLDYLVDMVGEMVIAQSLVRHDPSLGALGDPRLVRNLAQLARITDEVQRTAMAMRMVPIGPLFQKMARLVRDLSRRCDKQVQFECEGEDVELDRNIVEELADPLMHMVRNAVDHGIESRQERLSGGKREAARVFLRAFHRAGQIVIQVSDDGRGINRDKVLAKARAKGLISATANVSDSECFNFIFHPGFSTAEQVSDVSGRGVGLDVVRKQIQKLRGSVDIESVPGQGTTFSLRLPLTLAIIDGLVVAVGSDRYIIPLASVKELLRPTPAMIAVVENRAEVVLIREKVLPMLRLYERFGTVPRSTNPAEAVLVIADADGTSFCLMVDDLIGKQEVVIKSLGPVFGGVSGVAGGAILGDGRVGLILDLKSLFGGGADA